MLPDSSRLFFAIWPDDATRDRVAGLARGFHQDYGGKQMTRESLHLTLAFLGQTLDSRIAELQAIGCSIATPPFELILSRAGTWSGGIFWLAPDQSTPPLITLVTALHSGLASGGFAFDEKPFVPHVTLLRKVQNRPVDMTVAPIKFAIGDFALVRSLPAPQGVRYELIDRFALLAI